VQPTFRQIIAEIYQIDYVKIYILLLRETGVL